jgi:hypothetical protein
MSVLVGLHDYILFTADYDFLDSLWTKYKLGIQFITNKIDSTGMAYINGTQAWGRTANASGHTTDGNMLLYRTLVTAAALATWQNETDTASSWSTLAESVKAAVNAQNWDASVGAYINSDVGTTVYPEDGNSMALYFNGSLSSNAAKTSDYLKTLWGPIGAVTPELPDNVVPYIEGFEIKGHLSIRETQRALDLIRLSWGWYLNSPYGTKSTIIEGYKTDGTFDYRGGASFGAYVWGGAYTSHSHGWSTGPTDALTSYIVGLQPTAPGGKEWSLAPQMGDLSFAEAGFTTPLGSFSAGWKKHGDTLSLSVSTPKGTRGEVILPSTVKMTTKVDAQMSQSPLGETLQTFSLQGGEQTFTFSVMQ